MYVCTYIHKVPEFVTRLAAGVCVRLPHRRGQRRGERDLGSRKSPQQWKNIAIARPFLRSPAGFPTVHSGRFYYSVLRTYIGFSVFPSPGKPRSGDKNIKTRLSKERMGIWPRTDLGVTNFVSCCDLGPQHSRQKIEVYTLRKGRHSNPSLRHGVRSLPLPASRYTARSHVDARLFSVHLHLINQTRTKQRHRFFPTRTGRPETRTLARESVASPEHLGARRSEKQ